MDFSCAPAMDGMDLSRYTCDGLIGWLPAKESVVGFVCGEGDRGGYCSMNEGGKMKV